MASHPTDIRWMPLMPCFGFYLFNDLQGNLHTQLFIIIFPGFFKPVQDFFWDGYTRNVVVQVLGHAVASDGGYTCKNIYLIKDVPLIKGFQPEVQSVRIKDQVGLEKLGPCIDLFLFPRAWNFGSEAKGEAAAPRNNLGGDFIFLPSR